ncbi:Receptor-interacting serine/threonine-protein kinase 2 [Tulasnella sp. UAMH 9824]|nr:Receptor-interacting serine/threonine-protein kinase 2 [Tulasnella sp. UAMH 9824]
MLDGKSKVAVKELKVIQASGKDTRTALRFARELKVWAKLQHPNVLKLVGYYLSYDFRRAQPVSLYYENGNVVEYMRRTPTDIQTRLGFVHGITLGLRYLHDYYPPICHGDLKPVNVLINNKPDAVLCDFGLARLVEESGVSTGLTTTGPTKGSLRYMSPELFDSDRSKHTLKSDIWAWACTIFEILTERTAYADYQSENSIFAAISGGFLPGSVELLDSQAPALDAVSRLKLVALQALIQESWQKESGDRPSSSRIIKRLEIKDPDPTQRSGDQREIAESFMTKLTTPKLSIRPIDQLRKWNYHQMKFESQTADGLLSEEAASPDVVYRFHGAVPLAVSPTGKWIVTGTGLGRRKRIPTAPDFGHGELWNSENPNGPPIRLPYLFWWCDAISWSPNERYIAYVSNSLRIWCNEVSAIHLAASLLTKAV